ncbi:MAG: phytanoyl-CoA dioxygenase, partial [Bacteroidetes bacterium]
MLELRDLFRRYTGFLRSLKLVYVLNNLLHWKHLWRNRPLYRRLGLKKSVFAPIGSQDFPQPAGPPPWLDRPDALQALRRHPEFLTFDAALQKQLEQFVQQGYLILRGFHPADKVDALNAEIERLLREKRTGFNYTGRKIMDAFRFSPLLDREFFRNPELLRILEFIMGRPIIPFQTINFLVGSEQRAHSDSIHMTTEPKGYL